MNPTCSLRELGGDQSPVVHQTHRSVIRHQPPIGRAGREEIETTGEGETIENLRDLKSKGRPKKDILTMEHQDLMKENEKLRTVLRTTVAVNVKMKCDNQTLFKD
jgi:hypothetical protein